MEKQTKKWTMRDGSKISIYDMSDSHLSNALNMIERKAEAGALYREGWFDPIGCDHVYDEYYLYGQDYLNKVEGYHELKSERRRRNNMCIKLSQAGTSCPDEVCACGCYLPGDELQQTWDYLDGLPTCVKCMKVQHEATEAARVRCISRPVKGSPQ